MRDIDDILRVENQRRVSRRPISPAKIQDRRDQRRSPLRSWLVIDGTRQGRRTTDISAIEKYLSRLDLFHLFLLFR